MEAAADTRSRLQPSDDILLQCPTCDKKIKRSEVANHCQQELQSLQQMQANGEAAAESPTITNTQGKPWTIFQRVQRNRQSRQKQRSRKRVAAAPTVPETTCPLCNKSFPQTQIQRHADHCLQISNGATTNGRLDYHSSEEDDYEEGADGAYEEYEWAGQKRIRVSTMLEGGYAALGIGQSNTIRNGQHRNNEDEDEDLNVDEDDTHIYGPTQYNESDVITPGATQTSNENADDDVTSYMRRLITGTKTNSATSTSHLNNESGILTTHSNTHVTASEASTSSATPNLSNVDDKLAIEALKSKLRFYESNAHNKFKCLICLDDYKKPAISVCCWHVHCEECWLRSLGARKLCPQCNLITTSKDLRRIYM